MSEAIRHYTNEFRAARDVSPYDAEVLFDALISEKDERLLVELLSAWSQKGATQDEMYRFAAILRKRMKRVDTRGLACVDIVGTGGSAAKTFNVSTAAAFVTAGSGVAVAKHGNRAATSSSGSADVLTHLGIDVDVEPEKAEESLHSHGIAFMFAPRHHSLSPELALARKRVGAPTIFNCVGPLANPAAAEHQLIGVWTSSLVPKVARVLQLLGTGRSWIVNTDGHLDELSPHGTSHVSEVLGGLIHDFLLDKDELDLDVNAQLPRAGNASESAALIESILRNEMKDTPAEVIVLLNAAAAISLVSYETLSSALERAKQSIRKGEALAKLEALRSAK